MSSSNRIFYACEYVALAPEGAPASGVAIHGLQSVNTNTSFNLEQVLELGQLSLYENIEDVPNVEMTLEKVLDGRPLIYHLSTPAATSPTLLNRTNGKCDAVLSVFLDTLGVSSGSPMTQVYTSGLYVNTLNYTLPVQGNCRESVSLVGNDRVWKTSAFYFNGQFTDNNDSPNPHVQRRQNVNMGSGSTASYWPTLIPGITILNSSGVNIDSNGFGAHIQEVTISTNLNRESLFELGRRRQYYRYANFPIEVDCTINVTPGGSTPGDLINANADSSTNLNNETIIIRLTDGTEFNLGQKNKLMTTTWSGGDATGGVVTIGYQFKNFNDLTIRASSDPNGL